VWCAAEPGASNRIHFGVGDIAEVVGIRRPADLFGPASKPVQR
jgi:hypothetical protein